MVQSSQRGVLGDAAPFDARTIPAYAGDHAAVYAHIRAHRAAHTAELQRWLRQPSISAQNVGVLEMAELLRHDLLALGFREAELAPTDGHPGVFGFYDAGAPRTLLVYMMYDVQPVEPADWRSPPFAAEIVDHELGRVLMGRGAVNQKGPERAFLNAVASIIAVEGTLPVNLFVAAEGEEELGSPHYPQVVAAYAERLRTALGAFFPFPSQNPQGETTLPLGVKGIAYWELEAIGSAAGGPTRAEIHGSFKAIVDSPVWRLVQALATLTSADGNTIAVQGYTDAVRPPSDEERSLLRGMLAGWDEESIKRVMGVERWVDGISGEEALLRYLCRPTLNIDGIWAGYTGEGTKTILPHKATAKVDSRLVPNQKPEEALRLVREHLDRNGFSDIQIRELSGYPPAQSSVTSSLVQAAIGVYNKYGKTPLVQPRLAGSAPYYVFTDTLGLPTVMGGLGHGSGAHAPNEYLVLEPAAGSSIAGLAEMEMAYADLLYALASA
ncbi:MAG TPA: M20/M25/M40 family metallo-hydrolase [Dehalococcoidia bacterium]|nr:M20/M25/M40 family metallo-hydrolase [Dehalococcoidia bacterium]